MKLYLVYQVEIPPEAKRILISYYECKNMPLDQYIKNTPYKEKPDIFLDSGAFSAFTQKKHIGIIEYCNYIKKHKHLITTYANLDVIGSASLTYKNQKWMENQGLSPLPVFHVGDDWDYLERYIDEYPYVALGGMVPYSKVDAHPQSRAILLSWLVQCFKRAKGKAVFHGFGCTIWRVMKEFPWYSVDSSAWSMGFRYGEMRIFDERQAKLFHITIGSKGCFTHAHVFRSLGFDPNDFFDRSRYDRKKMARLVALSFLRAEAWVERLHGAISIPERTAQ